MVWVTTIDNVISKPFLAYFKLEKVPTENFIFRLFYKVGFWTVFSFLFVYTYLSFDPISCMSSKDLKKDILPVLEYHCWTYGTFTVEKNDQARQIYPGIGPIITNNANARIDLSDRTVIRYHHYYKFMYASIVIMLVLLQVPKLFWKLIENKRMSSLLGELSSVVIIGTDENLKKKKDHLVEYLISHQGYHRRYAGGFVVAEVLNVAVCGVIMWMWDYLVDYEFSRNGGKWYGHTNSGYWREDRMAGLFPLLGKCVFKSYGPSGSVRVLDILCILKLNIYNEMAAVFFWYFFMTLVTIGSGAVAFRIVLIFSQRLRMFLLSGVSPLTSLEDIKVLVERLSYSDWFMVYQIGKAAESKVFREVLEKVVRRMKGEGLEIEEMSVVPVPLRKMSSRCVAKF